MLGINGSEFVVLLVVAAVVLGPERLPHYTQQLARLIRELRRMAQGAQEKVREELGPDFDDVNWRALDPRQYDPRRIVREAFSEAIDVDDPLGIRDFPSYASMASDGRSADERRPSTRYDDGPDADGGGSGPVFDPDAT